MIKYSKLSAYKIKKILKLFCADIPAVKAAEISNFNRKTIDRYYNIFREKIAHASDIQMQSYVREFPFEQVCINTDQLCKRARKGEGMPVFGIIKKDEKVFVSLVKECERTCLAEYQPAAHINNSYPSKDVPYNGLLLNTYDHYRVYATGNHKNNLSGVETFWSFAKRRLTKFNGIAPHKFNLYIKECEFRFNYRKDDLYRKMLTVLRDL